MKSWILC